MPSATENMAENVDDAVQAQHHRGWPAGDLHCY